MYLSASGAVPVLFTKGAVLGCEQQVAPTFSFTFPVFLRTCVCAVPQEAAG